MKRGSRDRADAAARLRLKGISPKKVPEMCSLFLGWGWRAASKRKNGARCLHLLKYSHRSTKKDRRRLQKLGHLLAEGKERGKRPDICVALPDCWALHSRLLACQVPI
jgi:hypothetical protein